MIIESSKKKQFKIYFFYPAFRQSDQDRIERLLCQINKSYKEAQIKRINASGRIAQEKLFEKYFGNSKTSQFVRRRVGLPPLQLFKLSKTGNAIYLRGVVALVKSGLVQWANKPPQSFEFLNDIALRGPKAIEDLYGFSESIEDEEVDLIDTFESSKYCEGNLERYVRLPPSNENSFINETSKWIDAVLKKPNGQYIIIEAKMVLNYESIGQALCYNRWFRAFKKITSSTPAILCQDFKQEFLNVCSEIGIIVFSVKDDKVIQHNA